MPRANRHYLPGLSWHITHRCHNRSFLLKAQPQKRSWLHWIREAKKRYKLGVLSYTVTDNHIHLIACDVGPTSSIAPSMKLAAGSSAQRYNMVHQRKGAFWDDRYHATAIQTDIHLLRCITYVDCNMVRAGRVTHPIQWPWGSYAELQGLRQRYRLVDLDLLADLMGVHSRDELQVRHKELVEQALAEGCQHDDTWTESIAVGSQGFVESVKKRLKGRANHRKVEGNNVVWALREDHNPYGEEYIAPGNEYSWEAEHMAFDAFTKLRP